MVRPKKDIRFKMVGSSLVIIKDGVYITNIPHSILYQLALLKKRNGKEYELVKSTLIKEEQK